MTKTTDTNRETTAPPAETPAKSKPAARPARKRKKTAAKTKPPAPEPPPVAAETPASTGPGRPRGSVNEKKPEVVATLTRCPFCNSTDRHAYYGIITRDYSGNDPITGQPYNRISWKRTKCAACDRARVDKFYQLVKPARYSQEIYFLEI